MNPWPNDEAVGHGNDLRLKHGCIAYFGVGGILGPGHFRPGARATRAPVHEVTEPSNAEILRAIGDLEGTVRAIGAKLDDHRDRMNAHGKRIDALMTEQAKLATKVKLYGTGAGALAAGAVTLVVAAVKYLIGVK